MEHYLQVTEADYAKAAGKATDDGGQSLSKEVALDNQKSESEKAQHQAQQQAPQHTGTDEQVSERESENPGDLDNRRESLVPLAPPVGLEPTTQRLTAACSTN